MLRLRSAGCVFAEEEAALLHAQASGSELERLIKRRCGGEPLETVLGWVEFCGLQIATAPGVFVPRQRTSALAREAIVAAPPSAQVLDLCCGTGAIAVVVASARPDVKVVCADIDQAATDCAATNLNNAVWRSQIGRSQVSGVFTGDLFSALPAGLRFDVVVANVPYVPSDHVALLPPEARDYEPHVALDGGADGLTIARRVIAEAPRWLKPGGVVLIELAPQQVEALTAYATSLGYAVHMTQDPDDDTCVWSARLGTA